jgi:hypothetical protein
MKQLVRRGSLALAGLLPLVANAAITVPADFTSAKADSIEAAGLGGGALIAVAAAAVVVLIFAKYVKKMRGAA